MCSWLLDIRSQLEQQERMSVKRRGAIANALMESAHSAFPLSPIYWHRMMRMAQRMDDTARPQIPIGRFDVAKHISPLVAEWLLLPVRWFTTALKRARYALFGEPVVRKVGAGPSAFRTQLDDDR
jgi:hypothetical protein